jgi:hypothetical protein
MSHFCFISLSLSYGWPVGAMAKQYDNMKKLILHADYMPENNYPAFSAN